MLAKSFSAALAVLWIAVLSFGQVDAAREAIDRGEYVRAVNLLNAELATNPTPDARLYLGIAYAHMKEFQRAEQILREAGEQYRDDPRFYNELAGIHLARNNPDEARSALRHALSVDPENAYASDLLATIDMSEGRVQAALRAWNRTGRPIIDDILHNYYLTFGSWTVRRALAFHPAGVLEYSAWRTTELRLWETGNFANTGLEIEPTPLPNHYNAIVRTSAKTNGGSDLVFGLLKGAPIRTSYFDLSDIRNSGMNFSAQYRWDPNRKRAAGRLKIPLPLPGLLFLDLGDQWRDEKWDLSSITRTGTSEDPGFRYKANSLLLRLKSIPHHRFELAAGIEYTNRARPRQAPAFITDRDSAKWTLQTTIRLADSRLQTRLDVGGFLARRSILGKLNYSGGTASFANRWEVSRSSQTFLEWRLKGGTSRGELPLEEYFVLGVDTYSENLLRGHAAFKDGAYGRSPMGTDFVLTNASIERLITVLPLFNTMNIPFLMVKWEVFVDAAKTFDRSRTFEQGKLWVDIGAGLKLQMPASSFHVVFGQSLRDGSGAITGYVERRF